MRIRSILLAAIAVIATTALVVQAQVPGVNSTLNSVFTLAYDNSTMKQTYSATVSGASPAASATDVCSLAGSATKTIKVRRVLFTSTPTTAVTEPISVLMRSTASTGAGSAIATMSYDSANAANTSALVEVWTSNPTAGTLTGVLADVAIGFGIATTANTPFANTFVFGQLGQPIVLRGVAQQVAVNLSGITFTGTFGCTFEWTEE